MRSFLCFLFVLSLCLICFFFFNDTATTEIYTLSLHDALPISHAGPGTGRGQQHDAGEAPDAQRLAGPPGADRRSEEHTSELQSHHDLVCRLLLEKKKKKKNHTNCHEKKDRKTR